jgi:phosphoribosylglycinamide formyltransferase 1
VLEREHVLYPRAVSWLVHDLLTLADGVVTQVQGESQLL